MSKYTDIATGRAEPTIPVIRKPVVKTPTKSVPKTTSNLTAPVSNTTSNKNIQQTNKTTLQQQNAQTELEKKRNPASYWLMEKGKGVTNKVLGKGWFSDILGSLPGGILRSVERPARLLLGSGYEVGQQARALTGNEKALEGYRNKYNPFLTQEDVEGIRTGDLKFLTKKGLQLGGDVSSVLVGPEKGMSLPGKLAAGGVSGATGALGEENPTLRSVAEGATFGTATAGAGHYIGKAVKGLRSGKTPDLPPTSPDNLQIEGPKSQDIEIPGMKKPSTSIVGKPSTTADLEPINKNLGIADNLIIGTKSLLNKFGKPGKKLSSMLDNYENTARVRASTAYNSFNKALKDFEASTKGSKLPAAGDSGNDRIVQYILDEYNHVPHKIGISPEEKKVADTFYQMVTLPTSLKAQEYGLAPDGKTIGEARMFLPQIKKDTAKWKKSMMERLISKGNTKDEAARIVNAILSDKKTPPINTKKASFEYARTFFPKTVEELKDFGYETDLGKIAAKWSQDSWKRLSAFDVFGPEENGEHVGAAAEFENMLKSGVDPSDVDVLKKNFMLAIRGTPRENQSIQNVGKLGGAYTSTKIGPSVMIQQPSTLGHTAAIAGEGRTVKSAIKYLANRLGIKNIPASDKALVDNAGTVFGGGLDDVLRADYGSGSSTIVNAIEKAAGAKFKLTGVPQLDTAVRNISAYASLDWVRDSVRKLASGKLSKKAYNSLYDEVRLFAIPDTSELDDIIARGGKMSSFETSKAIYQFGKKTQFGLSKAELPASWNSNTLAKIATRLKSFGYEQMQLFSRLASHAKRTGDWKPLIKSIGYTFGINAASAKVINMLYGNDEQKKDQNLILDTLGQMLFGLFYNTVKYSSSGLEAVGNLVTGPMIGDVANIGYQSIKAAEQEATNLLSGKSKHTNLRSLGKTIYKRVPPFNTVSQIPVVGTKIEESLFPPVRSNTVRR